MRTATYSREQNSEMLMTPNGGAPPFDIVMNYLHSIPLTFATKRAVYRQLQSEVYEEHLKALKKKMADISLLGEDWDGYEAEPVNPITLKNFKKALSACKPSDFADWTLSPNTNGTLLLERDEAAVSIASKEFSCYAEQGDRYMEENHRSFTVPALLDTVRRINTFLA